jgi:hypothetical protein
LEVDEGLEFPEGKQSLSALKKSGLGSDDHTSESHDK